MKLLICGSRTIQNKEYIYNCIDDVIRRFNLDITQIIEGNADGVDKQAGFYAIERLLKLETFPPNWKKNGKKAGYIRNWEMAHLCDGGIAIWDGISKGTKYTIVVLQKLDKLLKIYKSTSKKVNI